MVFEKGTTWKQILAAENGRQATIVHLDAGYWLWLVAIWTLAVGARIVLRTPDSRLAAADDPAASTATPGS